MGDAKFGRAKNKCRPPKQPALKKSYKILLINSLEEISTIGIYHECVVTLFGMKSRAYYSEATIN